MQESTGACSTRSAVPIQSCLGKRQLKLAPRPSAAAVTVASDSASAAPAMDNKDKDKEKDSSLSYLAQLLPGASEWPHSDESLTEALRLRQEQERTKQEYYRLESRKRTLEILAAASRAGIAGSAIPALFDYQAGLGSLGATGPAAGPVTPGSRGSAAASAAAASAAAVGGAEGPELVNYEDAQRSPTRFRATHVRSSSALPATQFGLRPVTQAYFPRPQQSSPQQPSSNLQFHHWKPSPRPDDKRPKPMDRSPTTKVKPEHLSPTPAPAVVAAGTLQQQRRRAQHMRHRSEAAIPSMGQRGPYWNNRTDEGASILANMATERSKHDVGYILTADRSPARGAPPPVQPSEPPQQPPAMGHPGPVQHKTP